MTLYRKTPLPWSETRRFNGTAWDQTDAVLSGDQLTSTSVPASRLKLDGAMLVADAASDALTIGQLDASRITSGQLSSRGYIAGEKGFHIDLAGAAEFNEAVIRGALIGGRVESATLVSSVSTIPTEAGKPFLTLENIRPLTYREYRISGHHMTIGPLMIPQDQASIRLGDARRVVLACDDPYQGVAGAAINPYFTRFWAYAPAVQIKMAAARTGQPWGEHIQTGRIQLRVETTNGDKIAESGVFDLSTDSRWQNGRQDAAWVGILSARHGFSHGSLISISRTVTHHADGQRYFTSDLAMDIRLGFRFSWQESWPKGVGVQFKILLDYSNATLNFTMADALAQNILIEGKTIDG